jgi:hypothetical protein
MSNEPYQRNLPVPFFSQRDNKYIWKRIAKSPNGEDYKGKHYNPKDAYYYWREAYDPNALPSQSGLSATEGEWYVPLTYAYKKNCRDRDHDQNFCNYGELPSYLTPLDILAIKQHKEHYGAPCYMSPKTEDLFRGNYGGKEELKIFNEQLNSAVKAVETKPSPGSTSSCFALVRHFIYGEKESQNTIGDADGLKSLCDLVVRPFRERIILYAQQYVDFSYRAACPIIYLILMILRIILMEKRAIPPLGCLLWGMGLGRTGRI